jgi:hypothetical protein
MSISLEDHVETLRDLNASLQRHLAVAETEAKTEGIQLSASQHAG